jgi:hypothetical protein
MELSLAFESVVPNPDRRLPEALSFDVTRQPTIRYVFAPTCSWCARNLDNFKALVDQKTGGYRFIGVSLTDQGLPDYVTKSELTRHSKILRYLVHMVHNLSFEFARET